MTPFEITGTLAYASAKQAEYKKSRRSWAKELGNPVRRKRAAVYDDKPPPGEIDNEDIEEPSE